MEGPLGHPTGLPALTQMRPSVESGAGTPKTAASAEPARVTTASAPHENQTFTSARRGKKHTSSAVGSSLGTLLVCLVCVGDRWRSGPRVTALAACGQFLDGPRPEPRSRVQRGAVPVTAPTKRTCAMK